MGSDESVPSNYSPRMLQERERLLNMQINKISIIMQPKNKFMKGYQIAASGFSMILPAAMTCANRNHVGIFIFGEHNSYDGLYMEFGPYDSRKEKNINACVHHLQGDDGLHFFLANYFNIEGYKIDCNVEYSMTVRNLFNSISHKGWTKKDYEDLYFEPTMQMLMHKDSKDFTKKIIKILGAKRINKSDRIRTFCKTFVPAEIIDAFEKNEGRINFEERIPIIGAFAGVVKMLATDD